MASPFTPPTIPASSFNGGTIDDPLTISTGVDEVQLRVKPPNGAAANSVSVQTAAGPAEALLYAENADATVGAASGSGNGGAFLNVDQTGGDVAATGPAHTVQLNGHTASAKVLVSTGASVDPFVVNPLGYLLIGTNAAPADAALAAGQVALWFDSTNGVGATKLMVKGKSADGTVKTAAIVLA